VKAARDLAISALIVGLAWMAFGIGSWCIASGWAKIESAHAAEPGPVISSAMPPERFRGRATERVKFVPAHEVAAKCGSNYGPDITVLACTRWTRRGRYIVMPLPTGEDRYSRLMAHEIAHAAYGWKHEER
jgi:hypothetical protein